MGSSCLQKDKTNQNPLLNFCGFQIVGNYLYFKWSKFHQHVYDSHFQKAIILIQQQVNPLIETVVVVEPPSILAAPMGATDAFHAKHSLVARRNQTICTHTYRHRAMYTFIYRTESRAHLSGMPPPPPASEFQLPFCGVGEVRNKIIYLKQHHPIRIPVRI
jgi:hypothetical protein